MEIHRWYYYLFFNCIFIKYLQAKTFSLNEVIDAESRQGEAFETTLPPKLTESTRNRYSLLKRLASTSRVKKHFGSGHFLGRYLDNTISGGPKISPLKYKKTFLIKTPLKPKKLKLLQKSRYKHKNKSAKREINGNENLKQKYIPLLKSLSMLFDNLLNSDTSESYEFETKKFKRNRFYSEDTFEIPHKCTKKPDSGNVESQPQKKTITSSTIITTEASVASKNFTITETTTTTADYITTRNFSSFRQNKNIPILLPRNTFSGRRIDNGISERSGTTHNGNFKGNITRDYGDHEHAAGCGQNESSSKRDEKNTNGFARVGAGGFRSSGANGNRNNTRIFSNTLRTNEKNYSKNGTTNDNIRENQFENRGNETKSARLLQEPIQRLRGFTTNQESVQSENIRKESIVNVTHDNSGHQRVTDGSSSVAEEDQKVRQRNETVISIADSLKSTNHLKDPQKKSPLVMIFDGYSVARHKNGENKFSEKSIHVHS